MTEEQLLDLFRDNMRAIREELGISQSELARRVGKCPGYICDVERGRRSVNLGTLASIADGLGVNPSQLISTALAKKNR
jgi:transcriptional regulator with XRE-family HTH domain